jgi:hypothetical protein
MRRPVRPDELIELAYHLAGRDAGRGRPRTVWLRRAMSSAYYALFHELVEWAVWRTVSDDPVREPERWTVARWYQHGDVRQVSEWISALATRGRGAPESVASLFGGMNAPREIPAGLASVAESFIALHDARQSADYDHAMDVTKEEALALVDRAADAINTWRDIPAGYHADLFMMLLLGGPRLARSR